MDEPELNLTDPEGKVETIDLTKAPIINRPDCAHDYIPDPTDETDDWVAMVCRNQSCGSGYLSKKRSN